MWQELYRLSYNYLAGLGLTHEDAEDLAQETLVAAYLHLDGVRPGKLKAWLFTVTRHKYIDWLRRTKKEVPLVDFAVEELADGAAGPEEAVLTGEAREAVAVALSRLDKPERVLLALKYNLGLTTEEISAVLKIAPCTVKVRLFRVWMNGDFCAGYVGAAACAPS